MWNNVWMEYVKDWKAHTKEDLIIQVISIVFILIIGMIAIRIMGKKSIAQLSVSNVMFIFILSSTLGALITKPNRIFIALLVVITIVAFVWIIETLQLKSDFVERLLFSAPSILYQDKKFQIDIMRKNKITIDQLETLIRQQGIPSFDVVKTILYEPTGSLAIQMMPDYEPLKKMYFDHGMQQIMKAIDDLKYEDLKPPAIKNLFDEATGGKNQKDVPKDLQ